MAKTPAVFVAHGAPLAALESGPYQDALAALGNEFRRRAVVILSAHWQVDVPVRIGFAEHHSTVHDFAGFPRELHAIRYDAPGSPAVAERVEQLLHQGGWGTQRDVRRGLDHGAWVPLRMMYPRCDVPVVPISLPAHLPPERLYALGVSLQQLRSEDILFIGSGGIVHNLSLVNFDVPEGWIDPWAARFDRWVWDAVQSGDQGGLFAYRQQPEAAMAVPEGGSEHFEPIFPVLGAAGGAASARLIYEGFDYANLSLLCFAMQ